MTTKLSDNRMAEGSEPLFRILGLLEGVKKSRGGYEARCPVPRHKHGDKHPSLSVGLGYDGRVLLKCFAGCTTEEILGALQLDWGALFERSRDGHTIRRFKLINGNGHVVAEHVREELPNDKKLWWENHGKRGLNGTPVVDLPLYRLPDLLAAPKGSVVVLTEGEKAADALAEIGVLAVATVTGASSTPCEQTLAPLLDYDVWLWPDADRDGREHMARIASYVPKAKWVDWLGAPEKGDAADYVAQGGTSNGIILMLRKAQQDKGGPKIWRGDELASAHFDPVRWAIPGILPAGLTILAGRPKLGKSWLMLGWCLDIASGRPILRKVDVQQGDTLYLALEDSPRRMQERQALMLGDTKAPYDFQVVNEWPRSNEGGLDLLEEWLDATPRARLIAIDTFKRFRPKEQRATRLYDLDYDAIAPLHELANRRNVAIVLVFHTNKLDPADPIDLVSGTLGLSGAADGVQVLKRERGQADASLFVTGRDVEEQDLALKWDTEDALGWVLLGQADEFRKSKERYRILEAVRAVSGMSPSEIADATAMKRVNVRYLLMVMTRDGDLRTRDGKYYPPLDTTPNSPNSPSTPSSTSTPTLTLTADSLVRAVRGVSDMRDVSSVSAVSGVVEEACPVHGLAWVEHECDALGDDDGGGDAS